MSTLRKDFMIPSVACSSQEDQENMMLEVTLLSSEWKSSTDGDLSTINRELAIQLAKHPNVDVSVLLPNCSEADRSSAKSHNVKLIEADRVPGFEPVLRLLFPPRDHKMDCVIGHGIHLGRPIASIKRNPIYSHCKWIQVVHSAPEEDGMYKNISEGQKMQETEIQLCKMADQVITIGPKLTETYKGYLRPVKQEEKVFDLTPSIFSEFLAVEQATEDKTTFSILVIGTCNSSDEFNVKGYDIAAKAIAELRDESYKLKFVCTAGGKGVIVAEKLLLDDISRNQLIVRSLDDGTEVLANLFCEVDLAIMPSRTEGFGVTALKALSASLPVLVSGNSGLGKALKKVPLGSQSVVDSVDPKDWAKEIKRVRQKERDVRLSESRLLREKYLEKYNWEEPCRSLVIKMKNLVFGKALHSSLDYEETERNKQGESIPGAVPRDSTKQTERNAKEAWTAAEKAPNTSLKRKRTYGDEQTKSVQEKSPNTSLKRKRTDGNEQAKSVQGGTSVSEDNKELNQLDSAERDSDVTRMKSTPPLERSVDSRNATGITPLMNAAMNGNVQAVKLLIEKGADPSLKDNSGLNSLHFAAIGGDTDIISLIHTRMPDIESLNGEGETPLLVAAYNGKLHAVKWFLERGANATYEDKGGWNALHSAAYNGDAETIDYILTHVQVIESKTADGETPLIIAVRHQKLQGVKCLLEKGANPLAKDNEGQDSLYYSSSRDPDLLGLVLSHVADSSTSVSEDNKELNQLDSAERDSDVTRMKSTPPLERSVDSRNETGITPLMNAAMNGNVQAVELLIKRGADPSLTDDLGSNSLHFAAAGGDTDIIYLIHTLMPDIDSLNGEGETPLLVAANSGKLHAVKWFLERGANATYEDKGGWNALHSAAYNGDAETIDYILTHVQVIESKTADGETPLIIAVRHQKLQGVKCLLEKGANPLAKDNEGQDSLYYSSSRDPDLLGLVLSHVADSSTSVSEDNKELNQLDSAERDSDVTRMKSTPPLERSVDSRNETGITPLMNAAMNGNVQAVELLIKRGADPSLTDDLGSNSLHFAAAGGDTDIIYLIHTLMPDIDSLNGEGETPLLVAANSGKLHAVKWFLERGAEATYEDKGGWNALHSAAFSGDPGTIDHILTRMQAIESRTADGATPLIIAVFCRKLQGVKCLLERGANPLAKDNNGKNSLHHASCDSDLLDLVLSYVPDS